MNEKPTSGRAFVRPPSSPVFGPTGPTLALPRRGFSTWPQQSIPAHSFEATVEARRQIAHLLTVIRAAEDLDQASGLGQEAPVPELPEGWPSADQVDTELDQAMEERERAVEERERRLAERERDQAEAEVLLQHHQSLLKAARKAAPQGGSLSVEAQAALVALKAELDRQEAMLVESREALREREKFIESSEERLFEKVQEQQEKETELEQREEELRARETTGTPGAPVATETKRTFDEFNE